MTARILIVGGYGTFGARLARLLLDEPLTVVIAGRSIEAARQFCAKHRGRATLIPSHFDRNGDLTAQIDALFPNLVVDASGPFQVYGARPYRLIEACIARGVHYLDLADGAQFVSGVAELNEQARSRGVFALSGVSSFPVLTAAVVRRLATDMDEVHSVVAGIAPSPRAGVGANVIRAIAGYAGEPIRARRSGRNTQAFGLLEQRWMQIEVPGSPPLERRLFSLVEVPDTEALTQLWPSLREVWIGAAPVPRVFHRLLIVLARWHRRGWLPSLAHIAPLMHLVTRYCRWGPHRGGMFVRVGGTARDGRPIERMWQLVAEGESGPFIPSMAAECVIRKWLAGERVEPGARHGIHDVELVDYERMFARHQIVTSSAPHGLFARLFGAQWPHVPEALRTLHEPGGPRVASGVASVQRGGGLLARAVAKLFGFPDAATEVHVQVRFEATDQGERWTRTFGDHTFESALSLGRGRETGLLIERFGIVSIALQVAWRAPRLQFVVRGWRVWRMPLPLWLAPISETHECVEDGRFKFDVSISHPLLGLLVSYRGFLGTPAPLATSLEH